MRTLLLDTGKVDPAKLVSVLHYDGNPITARFIVADISLKHGLERPLKESVS
jgi:2-oxoglutarate/2-oxoacid ferredoxin oxidoreductase subunit alpha